MTNFLHQHLLSKDPEEAHNWLTKWVCRLQWVPGVMHLICWKYLIPAELKQPVIREGITFPHAVGMAAGFDKQGLLARFLQAVGFGFVEVGTILPYLQIGNALPRIFRPFWGTLINRMGFNSLGADAVCENLLRLRGRLHIPIGISLGKMKDTSLANAWEDFVEALNRCATFFTHIAYVAINVSSPNTPGLRELQGGKYLEHLVKKVVERTEALAQASGRRAPPVVVKISPDDPDEDTIATVQAARRGGARGVIIGNTSLNTTFGEKQEAGGVSGYLILERALHKVALVRKEFPDLFIIGVGGIMSGAGAVRMKLAGADVIQLYTGFIFRGPPLIVECLQALLRFKA